MWLLWIHPEFKSYIQKKSYSEKEFNFLRGEDWPNIENLDSVTDPVLRKEIEDLRFIDIYPNDPVQFIIDNVYTEDRTYYNWLSIEWQYRLDLYNFELDHRARMEYTVLCTIDPELAYYAYFKFVNNLAGDTVDKFRERIQKFNDRASRSTNLVVDNTLLYKPELDLNYYKQLTDYFNLEDRYSQAQAIHSAWYTAQVRSATDFIREAKRIYG